MNILKTTSWNLPLPLSLLLAIALLPLTSAFAIDVTIKTNGEKMEFSPTKFTVKAGENVKLTFTNSSKSMEHNFVLGKIGTADKIAADSIAAGAPTWTSKGPEVLKATAMLKPLAKETLTFEAPKDKGDYPFLCTFPGHGAIMRGAMTVK